MNALPFHLPILLLASLAAAAAYGSERCEARSGPKAATVVELYTSEGCNSCPPADQWMSSLKGRDDLVALGFHVDYWDRLGWVDRFASPAYTQRQTEVQRGTGLGFNYTPQLVVNGRDWRSSTVPSSTRDSVVDVRLAREGDVVRASITPRASAPGTLAGFWAGVEDGHVSRVKSGENAGVTLRHDDVVRSYQPVPAWSGPAELRFSSPAVGEGGRVRRVVLVVTDARTGAPVQALSVACSGS